MQVKQTPETQRFLGQLAFSLEEPECSIAQPLRAGERLVQGWILVWSLVHCTRCPCEAGGAPVWEAGPRWGLWQPSAFCLAQGRDARVLSWLKVSQSEVSLSPGHCSGPWS